MISGLSYMVCRPARLAAALFFSTASTVTLAAPPVPGLEENPAVVAFVQEMAERHGFEAAPLLNHFSQVQVNPRVLQLIKPPASPQTRSWERYRGRFINERRIENGLRFWQNHRALLERAQKTYGVPASLIVAIIGIETEYGRNKGGFSVLEALSTLAFAYPPRAEFFRTELEQFLLLTRENRLDPTQVKGSFAGAIGIPQFMPGSQRRYAVDFDEDGRIDLDQSVADAIGSVARFLEQHGWQNGQPVAEPLAGDPAPELVEAGIRPTLGVSELKAGGVDNQLADGQRVAVIDLATPGQPTEYWLGYDNFYVITRYNRSSFYAMSVFQLAERLRSKMAP